MWISDEVNQERRVRSVKWIKRSVHVATTSVCDVTIQCLWRHNQVYVTCKFCRRDVSDLNAYIKRVEVVMQWAGEMGIQVENTVDYNSTACE